VVRGIERLESLVGAQEARRLLSDGPRVILHGEPQGAPPPWTAMADGKAS
jgi:hypothetical protein